MSEGFIYNDGGRGAAGFKGHTGDCCTRAIAIATGKPYIDVYNMINEYATRERTGKRKRKISNARTGVFATTARKIMDDLGWEWVPTMRIGSGCTVHLLADELPSGTIMISVSRHYTTMIDGVIHDTYDPRRETHWTEPYRAPMPDGYWTHDNISMHHIARRCVYGYWQKTA